ncbi:MAG TPA: serine/threonine-protein kinase, partial [Archangium sp.]|nr:serine/threonine-protein kinase [Archangium sp.]
MKKNEAAAVSWSSSPSVVVDADLDERTMAADMESLFAPVPPQPHTWDGPSSSGHSSSGHSSSGLSGSGYSGSHPSGSGFTSSGEQDAHALKPGTRIQHYELIRELGSGGMGTVFLARDTRLGRRVAIKFLHTQDADVTRRFILEARTTARCSHENIVIIYEVGESHAGPFMVLEFLEGQPLMKVMGKQRLPPARAVELMVPVVRALACAHEQGIVHRDLKPENIVVTNTGAIKVLDFGIAKVLQGPERAAEHTHAVPLPVIDDTGSNLT